MLNNQLAKGNNGLVRTKYITFGIEADNIREARPKLVRIESDILNNFKILGVWLTGETLTKGTAAKSDTEKILLSLREKSFMLQRNGSMMTEMPLSSGTEAI